jgi:inhibitor of KinA sporulation pathway (predicted exonuclease)
MNYCFADFEFTCGGKVCHYNTEIISAGIIICDSDYNLLDTYYSTAKPIGMPQLHELCIEITHLKQHDIDISPSSSFVCKEITKRLDKYGIENIFVWGDYDKIAVRSDMRWHKKKHLEFEEIKRCAQAIVDIQKQTITKMGLKNQVGISALLGAFELAPCGSLHNALTDATALYQICRVINTTDFNSMQSFNDFKVELLEKERLQKEKIRKLNAQRREKEISTFPEIEQYFVKELSSRYGIRAESDFIRVHRRITKAVDQIPDNDLAVVYYPDPYGFKIVPVNSNEYKHFINVSHLENSRFSKMTTCDAIIKTADRIAKSYAVFGIPGKNNNASANSNNSNKKSKSKGKNVSKNKNPNKKKGRKKK